MVVLAYIEPPKNIGGATRVYHNEMTKVGGAIAPPAPPVPAPLLYDVLSQGASKLTEVKVKSSKKVPFYQVK